MFGCSCAWRCMRRSRYRSSRCLVLLMGLAIALLAKPFLQMAQAVSGESVADDRSSGQAGAVGTIVAVREIDGLAALVEASGFEVLLAVGPEGSGDTPLQRLLFCRKSCGVLGEGRFKVEDLRVGSRLLVQIKRLELAGGEVLVAGDAVGLGENRELVGYVASDSMRSSRSKGRVYHSVRVIEFGDGSSRSSPRVVRVQWCVEGCDPEATLAAIPPRIRRWEFVTLQGTRESRKVFTLRNVDNSLIKGSPIQDRIGEDSLRQELYNGGRLRGRMGNPPPPALKVLKPILVLASRAFE